MKPHTVAINLLVVIGCFLLYEKKYQFIQTVYYKTPLKFFAFIFLTGSFVSELTDSITDAIYFASIERRKSLITIENTVLYAMSVFLFIAIVKDVICTFLTVRQYRISKNMHRGNLAEVTETDRPMTHPELAQLKTYKFTFCCLMEDFVQCNLQFFYIEKFLLEEDLFIYINSAIMIVIYLWFGGQLVVLLINNRQMQRVKKYYIVGKK